MEINNVQDCPRIYHSSIGLLKYILKTARIQNKTLMGLYIKINSKRITTVLFVSGTNIYFNQYIITMNENCIHKSKCV